MLRRELMGEVGSRDVGGAASGSAATDPFSSRPDLWPPANAITFSKTAFWDSPAAIGNNEPAGLVMQLPPSYVGIIRNFSEYVNDMIAADAILWQIKVNGAPAIQWDAATMFPTLASFRTVSDDPFVKLPRGAEVRINILNGTATAHKLGANYSGWMWPDPAASSGS